MTGSAPIGNWTPVEGGGGQLDWGRVHRLQRHLLIGPRLLGGQQMHDSSHSVESYSGNAAAQQTADAQATALMADDARDAARYRWLRNEGYRSHGPGVGTGSMALGQGPLIFYRPPSHNGMTMILADVYADAYIDAMLNAASEASPLSGSVVK